MVYRGGLENRFGLTANGGSNPSPSANKHKNNTTQILIWTGVAVVIFAVLWFTGNLVKLRNYVGETREELRKCTWPSWDELRGSTVLVIVSIVLLGVFTVIVDFALANFVSWMARF